MFIRDLKQEKSTKSFIDLDAFEEHSTNEHNRRKTPPTKVEMHAKSFIDLDAFEEHSTNEYN